MGYGPLCNYAKCYSGKSFLAYEHFTPLHVRVDSRLTRLDQAPAGDEVQHFFTTQLSGFSHFISRIFLILIGAHVAQI